MDPPDAGRGAAGARAAAERCRNEAPNAATGMVLEYMNSQPSHRFTHIREHLTEAQATADQIEKPLVRKQQLARERQQNLLRAIDDQPQPFYIPAAHSARIFSLNESVLRCTRTVRKILTQDWAAFDLWSAQLAICAAEWQVLPVLRFLETGRSI